MNLFEPGNEKELEAFIAKFKKFVIPMTLACLASFLVTTKVMHIARRIHKMPSPLEFICLTRTLLTGIVAFIFAEALLISLKNAISNHPEEAPSP